MSRPSSPLVSVVMPVFNAKPYLREAIESILLQTLGDLELIAVDDGSTDGSEAILDSIEREDPRVRVIHQENAGVSSALNRGFSEARGEYIARMDSDDVSLPSRFARQTDFLRSHPEVGACGSWIRNLPETQQGSMQGYPIGHEEILCALLFESPMCHPSIMLRRKLWEVSELRYDPSFRAAEDYDLWEKASTKTRLANLPEVLFLYRRHSSQKTSQTAASLERDARRRIQERLLKKLDLQPTERQWAIHLDLGQWRPFTSLETNEASLRLIREWLEELWNANSKAQVFPVQSFTSELSRRWYRACSESSSKLGFRAWRAFRASRLSREQPSFRREIRFALKCARHAWGKAARAP